LRALRRDDMLALNLELRNLRLGDDGQSLVREGPGDAVLIVGFPGQHVSEMAFFQDEADTMRPRPAWPLPGRLAQQSRLAFSLPPELESLPLTLDALLDWAALQPRLAPNALPRGASDGPEPAMPADDVTAIEFPYRLLLSPVGPARWQHAPAPVAPGGRAELWHTRLVGEDGSAGGDVRAIAWREVHDPFDQDPNDNLTNPVRDALTASNLSEIVRLSADFTIAPKSWFQLGMSIGRWMAFMRRHGLLGYRYQPKPIDADQLMLSAPGAWARLRGEWTYPEEIDPFLPPDVLDQAGMPKIALEQYQHRATMGRDQFVRVVTRGILLPTCHPAVQVTTTERQFSPEQIGTQLTPDSRVAIFGATAYLRQYSTILVKRPLMRYDELGDMYTSGGREMPLRSIRLLTTETPKLDAFVPGQPFWVRVGGQNLRFSMLAEDAAGKPVSFALPLMFVPYEALGQANMPQLQAMYVVSVLRDPSLATAPLGNQPVHLAPPLAGDDTALPAESLTIRAFFPPGPPRRMPSGQWLRPFLPYVDGAEVHLEAMERLTGSPRAVAVRLDPTYLAHGFDPAQNQAELFVSLAASAPVAPAADRAGGLARPTSTVNRVSRRQGALDATFAKPHIPQTELATLFGNARILGALRLGDILDEVTPAPADFERANLPDAELMALVEARGPGLPVPVLRTRQLEGGAVETRYLWKPRLRGEGMFELAGETDLTLDARIVTAPDGATRSLVTGRLRGFALSFLDVARLTLQELTFRSEPGKKPDISAEGVDLSFAGPLTFVNTLRNILPQDGFSDPPFVEVTPGGIRAGYTLGVPTVGVGVFSLQNIAISAGLAVPFGDEPASVSFALSERHHPFTVTVAIFGGGGFFGLVVSSRQVEQVEAAIEFGGNFSLNLGVASGGVFVMAGVYFQMKAGSGVTLTGYLRCGGHLSVLGLISISLEFYLALTYREKQGGSEVWGQATVKVSVKIAFFSTSVSLSLQRRFAGAGGDPTFEDTVEPEDWAQYCAAFA
jgi:hypothetical protein